MRILYISTGYPPHVSGGVTFLVRLMAGMQQRGHEIGVIVPAFGELPHRRLYQGVMEYHLASIRNPFRVKHYGFFTSPQAALAAITDFKPDLIHCNDPLLWPQVVTSYGRENGVPVVLTHHATAELVSASLPSWSRKLAQKLANWWFRSVLNLFDLVTVPTKTVEVELQTLKLTRPTIKVISNGVDVTKFKPVADSILTDRLTQQNQLDKPLRVIYVGRLDVEKGVKLLGQALDLAKTKFELWLVGSGLEERQLRAFTAIRQLTGWVKFFGQVNEKKVIELCQQADVFVMPSAIETQSIATLEAAACGLPLVVAKAAALPELVEFGVNGYLFKPYDAADLVKKLAKIAATSVKERMALARASRAVALRHRLSVVITEWNDLYCHLVNRLVETK